MSAYIQIAAELFRPVTLMVVFLVVMIAGCSRPVESDEKVIERIMPVARFEMGGAAVVVVTPTADVATEEAAATTTSAHKDGATVYAQICKTCHELGISGAPKMGDKTAWAPRIATGMEALYNSSINGKNVMPPKGGNSSLDDEDVKEAVDFMVAASQ